MSALVDTRIRNCTATTKRGKICWNKVESFRTASLCHVHDPDGTFRQQLKAKGLGSPKTKKKKVKTVNKKECQHTWYMREEGIQCTKCFVLWDKSMDTNQ